MLAVSKYLEGDWKALIITAPLVTQCELTRFRKSPKHHEMHPVNELLGTATVLVTLVLPYSAETAPQSTTATYADWILRCEFQKPPATKICDIVQTTQTTTVQNQTAPLTQISISRPAKDAPLLAAIQVPINVWLPAGVKLIIAEKEPAIAVSYKRCVPTTCMADIELKDDLVKKLKTLTEPGKITFQDASQHEVSVPFSFKGFSEALEAMVKE